MAGGWVSIVTMQLNGRSMSAWLAICREMAIKRWSCAAEIRLIHEQNPVDCPWIARGLPVNCPWIARELTVRKRKKVVDTPLRGA